MGDGDKPNGDGPKRFGPGELDDLSLLPKRFDFFVSETRDALERIERKLDALPRMEEAINDLRLRQRELEKQQRREDARRDRERRKARTK